jgi:hypothetical protein
VVLITIALFLDSAAGNFEEGLYKLNPVVVDP